MKHAANRLTKKRISAAIKAQTGWDVEIVTGKGYFYFSSSDPATALKLANFYTTSVNTYRLTFLSLEQWVRHFTNMLEKYEAEHEAAY